MAGRALSAALLAASAASTAAFWPVAPPVHSSDFIMNVKAFGAVGDGVTPDTRAFKAALAAVASAGGGTLYCPPSTYLIAPLNLTSRLVLLLDNATLLGSGDVGDWQVVAPLPSYGRGRDFPGPRYEALLQAWNASDVTITSNSSAFGRIDGQGAQWWLGVRNGTIRVTPGHLFESAWSSRIELSRITFTDSPFWNVHPWSSTDIWVHDVNIFAPPDSTNTDGVDPEVPAMC